MKLVEQLNDKMLSVKFFFPKEEQENFAKTLEFVKAIPGRIWNPSTMSWKVPFNSESISLLLAGGFSVDGKLKAIADKMIKEAEEKEAEILKAVSKIKFKEKILRDWQVEHCKTMAVSIIRNKASIDASDTGTGKTFSALQLAKYFGLRPIVVTKKRAIIQWERCMKVFGIEDFFVSNYEQFKFGKTDFVKKEKIKEETKRAHERYVWKTSEKDLIIFDEAHSAKNKDTANSEMVRATIRSESKVHCASATLAENPMHIYSVGKVIGLFKSTNDFWHWCFQHGVKKGFYGCEFNATDENLYKIHHSLFPKYGSRIAIKDLPKGAFPENLIVPDPIDMGKEAEARIQALYDEMNGELSVLRETKAKDSGASQLTAILRARQEIELLKVPIIVEMAKDYIEEGASVPIFVNFKETLRVLSEKLGTKCIIDGSTKYEDCIKNMDAFQADKERIILCNIASGGVAINLHDLNGKHNRVSIISPPQSAIQLVQAFGRIHRDGSKTKAVHRLLYCANTIEEEIAEKLEQKIDNIAKINDADLATAIELRAKKEEGK